MKKNNQQKNNNTEVGLIVVSVVLLAAFIVFMILHPTVTIDVIGNFFNKMISGLGPFFLVITFVTFIISLYLGFGKYGNVRLGECEPEYSNFSYLSMMLLASLASAALYWSFTEWAFYYENPGLGIKPGSTEALESSIGYQFFHWGMVNQSLYTVTGVAIAYGVYVKKLKSFQTSAVCSAMLGEKAGFKTRTALGKIVDFLVIFGVLGALSSSLGLAVPLASGGLRQLFGWETTPAVQVGIIVVIAIVYTITSYLGTDKGMKMISNAAAGLCICFILYILFAGPTTFILKNTVNSLGHMFSNFVRMSLFTDPVAKTGFPEAWTIYFVAFYLNYVAMMGIFIAKISKGRTIKEIAVATIFGMTAGEMFLFGIDGSFSIHSFLSGKVDVVKLVNSGVGEQAVYEIMKVLPGGAVLLPVVMLLLVVGFVAPSMDSASLALAETVTKRGNPKMSLRIFMCALLAIIPLAIILSGAGFTPIKQIAIIISLPFLAIIVGLEIGLFRWLRNDYKEGVQNKTRNLHKADMKNSVEERQEAEV